MVYVFGTVKVKNVRKIISNLCISIAHLERVSAPPPPQSRRSTPACRPQYGLRSTGPRSRRGGSRCSRAGRPWRSTERRHSSCRPALPTPAGGSGPGSRSRLQRQGQSGFSGETGESAALSSSSRCLTCSNANVVSSAAPVLRQSRDECSVAAHGVGGVCETLVAALTAVVIRQFSVQHPTAANLEEFKFINLL